MVIDVGIWTERLEGSDGGCAVAYPPYSVHVILEPSLSAGLELPEAQAQAPDALRNALIEGEESGEIAPVDFVELRDEARKAAKPDARRAVPETVY
jgi:hypothetical protein